MSETMLYESQIPLLYESTDKNSAGKPILGKLHAPFFDLNNPTRNGRDYSQVAEEALLSEEFKEKLATRTFFGRLGHPMTDDEAIEDPAVRACVILTDVVKNKKTNMIEGTLEIINNVYGQQLKSLIDAGCIMGVSTRGTGEAKKVAGGISTVMPGTYEFEALDVVTLPAVKKARCTIIESKGQVVRNNELDENKLLRIIETTKWTESQVFESLRTTIETSNLKYKKELLEGINIRLEKKDDYIIGGIRNMILEAEEEDREDQELLSLVTDVMNNPQDDEEEEDVPEFEEPENTETTEENEKLEKEDINDVKVEDAVTEEEVQKIADDTGKTTEEVKEEIQDIIDKDKDTNAETEGETEGMENNNENMNESETIVSLVNTITDLSEKLAKADKTVEHYEKLLKESKLLEAEEAEDEEEAIDVTEGEDETETEGETETDTETVSEEPETEESEESEINVDAIKVLVGSLLTSINSLKSQLKDVQDQSSELEEENEDLSDENAEKVEECVMLRKALRKNNEQLSILKEEYSKKIAELTDKTSSLQSELNESKKAYVTIKNMMLENVAKANRISVEDLRSKVSLNESIDSINSVAKSIRESMDRKNILGIKSLSDFGRTVTEEEFKENYNNDSLEEDSSFRFVNLVKETLK